MIATAGSRETWHRRGEGQRHREGEQIAAEMPGMDRAAGHDGNTDQGDDAAHHHPPALVLPQQQPGEAGRDEGQGGIDDRDIGDRGMPEGGQIEVGGEDAHRGDGQALPADGARLRPGVATILDEHQGRDHQAAEHAAPKQQRHDVQRDEAGEIPRQAVGDRRSRDERRPNPSLHGARSRCPRQAIQRWL
jgi:hypothetical protein